MRHREGEQFAQGCTAIKRQTSILVAHMSWYRPALRVAVRIEEENQVTCQHRLLPSFPLLTANQVVAQIAGAELGNS